MGDTLKTNLYVLLAILIAISALWFLASFSRVQGDVDLLECEKFKFGDKMGYYACVQAREVICIRQLLEKYD